MGFWHTNLSPNLTQKTRPDNQQKERERERKLAKLISWDSSVHKVKLKESEKDKYPDLARELKKLRNMKLTFIPIVFGALGRVTKGLIKGLEDLEITGRLETIQPTALLRSVRILRRVLESWCHSNFSERPSANTDVKTLKE